MPDNVRTNALIHYELENKINIALHGWEDQGFSRLLRRLCVTERRNDYIYARVIKYEVGYKDDVKLIKTSVSMPRVIIGTGWNSLFHQIIQGNFFFNPFLVIDCFFILINKAPLACIIF